MSTWLHLECLDHNPPIISIDESGQHLSDLPQIRDDLATPLTALLAQTESPPRSPFAPDPNYFRRHTATFRAQHPHCRIGIRDEYGNSHPTKEGS